MAKTKPTTTRINPPSDFGITPNPNFSGKQGESPAFSVFGDDEFFQKMVTRSDLAKIHFGGTFESCPVRLFL